MVYTNLKNTAVALRKQGFSFSEIKEKIPVSKSTLSKWFSEIKLSPVQRSRLKQKRVEAARRGAEKKIALLRTQIEEVQKNSQQEIGKISKRELWLMGVVLYWKNGNKNDLKKGVHFTSADPGQIKLFLKWLKEVGGLKKKEIDFDIFATTSKSRTSQNSLTTIQEKNEEEAKKYWAEITGFSELDFNHIYWLKKKLRKSNRKISSTISFGLLRIRVKASSMLARQISGWIQGLKKY